MGEKPVFYDASGSRNRWTMRAALALLLAILAAAVMFAMTLVAVPVPKALELSVEHPRARPLSQQVARLENRVAQAFGWLPAGGTSAKANVNQISVGFYVPWDDGSRASLLKHIGQLDWVVPGLMSVTGPDHKFTVFADQRFDNLMNNMAKKPLVLPMVQNAINGKWDGPGTAALLHSKSERKRLLDALEPAMVARKASGAVVDFEELPDSAHADYITFLREARARFAPHNWLVTVTVPVDDDGWNLKSYAAVADKLFVMIYDEHSDNGAAGPIASQRWFVNQLRAAIARVGADKIIVAIGSYAYDWTGVGIAAPISVEEAWLDAHDSAAPIIFDRRSGNTWFGYEEDGKNHTVWMLDAASAWNQLRAADIEGVAGVALWRLGTEDPGVWPALAAFQTGKVPDLRTLDTVGVATVDGSGEILRITDKPSTGSRSIMVDQHGLIVGEQFHSLPTPYVVTRTGYQPRMVALTFDDGPDGEWTPKVLDILKAKGVKATFFLIGENAMSHPLLLNRLVNEGMEIGNHSFSHPNLALVSPRGTRLELNLTQRVVQAYTGHSLRLFRAPYFGDAEPTTADELEPAMLAQDQGYTNVGLHVDPGDWKQPGVAAIVADTIAGVEAGRPDYSGNIVLLHDSGGDRSQTIAALPALIDALRARGYQLVPVSTLAGLTQAEVLPPITGVDLLAVRADIGIFLFIAGLGYALKWLFFAAIALGIARAIILAVLALDSNRPANRAVAPPVDPTRFVSVLIPAFNEARVIEASVRRVLDSRDVQIEVIVIDDGSQDDTSAIVRSSFAGDARVQLLTLPNGGKARALNHGLALARGEVIIALDADTQFEPETIARLSRWFAQPEIGAVAGNAKVGNRVNLVTRWQAVEYVTAQNLERRALSRFDAIMVVPGAVGAWRRRALDEVGGYPADTLAEDQDLTIAIQRRGWHVGYDTDAVAWTEAPESFAGLSKQRFRWAYGTLQCLWKHRSILRLRKPAGLAYLGIPQAWIFQIGFALISPLIDLALIVNIGTTWLHVYQHGWAQTHSDLLRMGSYWIAFTAIDVICGWIAYRLEARSERYPAVLLVAQRFVYRQMMYAVVIRAVANALRGPWVGWGKLERSGRVSERVGEKASA